MCTLLASIQLFLKLEACARGVISYLVCLCVLVFSIYLCVHCLQGALMVGITYQQAYANDLFQGFQLQISIKFSFKELKPVLLVL